MIAMSLEGRQLGRYVLRRLIGRGGTGEVYLADDQRLPRQVAIKVIFGEYLNQADAKVVARLFQREAQAIALLNHPNILPLFDFGEESIDGTMLSYLVTPFCPEGSFKEWLHRRPGGALLSPHELLALRGLAADALEYAHSKGIVHCDVKPSNFLVRSRRATSDQPDLLLIDFSIARLAQRTASVSQTVRGTPSYMSPEQWQGRPVPACDQNALACMAYELLTGSPHFQGTLGQLMYHHLTAPPQPPTTITRGLPPALDAVMLQALAKQPEARFPSVTAFVEAFHQAIQTAAQPPAPQLASTSSPVSGEVIANTPVQLSPPAGAKDTPHLPLAPLLQAGAFHVNLQLSAS